MLSQALTALDLTVVIDGTTHKVRPKPGDMVRFEQHFNRPLASEDATTSFGMTELFFLAFTALRREGKVSDDFDAFVDRVDDMDVAEVGAPKAG